MESRSMITFFPVKFYSKFNFIITANLANKNSSIENSQEYPKMPHNQKNQFKLLLQGFQAVASIITILIKLYFHPNYCLFFDSYYYYFKIKIANFQITIQNSNFKKINHPKSYYKHLNFPNPTIIIIQEYKISQISKNFFLTLLF